MACEQIVLRLPGWVEEFLDERGERFGTEDERMRLIIELSQLNVEHRTGGPFGAGVFEQQTGRIVAVGVNVVESYNCSIAHAEIVAIALAEQSLGCYDLGAEGRPTHELVASTEPCAMCLGAIPWSGVRRVVCGARGEDAVETGFDEGAKPSDWVGALQSRGIEVVRDVLREEARAVLRKYRESGGLIYNARRARRGQRS
ncbi:MAG: nucleoside deaminase [Phycisphaerales bacterium]|nr:MAG: nucleoside deaminase [Phycisphaerales bacterium]